MTVFGIHIRIVLVVFAILMIPFLLWMAGDRIGWRRFQVAYTTVSTAISWQWKLLLVILLLIFGLWAFGLLPPLRIPSWDVRMPSVTVPELPPVSSWTPWLIALGIAAALLLLLLRNPFAGMTFAGALALIAVLLILVFVASHAGLLPPLGFDPYAWAQARWYGLPGWLWFLGVAAVVLMLLSRWLKAAAVLAVALFILGALGSYRPVPTTFAAVQTSSKCPGTHEVLELSDSSKRVISPGGKCKVNFTTELGPLELTDRMGRILVVQTMQPVHDPLFWVESVRAVNGKGLLRYQLAER